MDVKALAELYEYNNFVVNANTEDVSNEASLLQPGEHGNCMNWVLGHIVRHRNYILKYAGGEPTLGQEYVPVYDRGAEPLVGAAGAMPFDALVAVFRESQERLEARFNSMRSDALSRDAGEADAAGKTIGQMLGGLMFHEAYHAGQLGILRRMIGKDGALK